MEAEFQKALIPIYKELITIRCLLTSLLYTQERRESVDKCLEKIASFVAQELEELKHFDPS